MQNCILYFFEQTIFIKDRELVREKGHGRAGSMDRDKGRRKGRKVGGWGKDPAEGMDRGHGKVHGQ